MATVAANGSLTLTAAEQVVGAAQNSLGIYVLSLDLSPMAAGDIVELYIYLKTLSAGALDLHEVFTWQNAQTKKPGFQTVAITSPYSLEFRLKQPAGSFRTIDYNIVSL